jgi:phosphoglycolate phosphatase
LNVDNSIRPPRDLSCLPLRGGEIKEGFALMNTRINFHLIFLSIILREGIIPKGKIGRYKTMRKKKAVIFDCDGVMFDSQMANTKFYNHILRQFGLPPMTPEKMRFVHMHTADESIRYIFKDSPYLEQARKFRAKLDYTPFISDMVMEPGLIDLLEELKPRFGLAVATNRSNTIGRVIKYHGLDGIFDMIISSLDVKKPKPHPESLLKIMEFFEIGPSHTFYVGDSTVDQQTARAAGVVFISYKNKSLEADHHVYTMMEIAKLLR